MSRYQGFTQVLVVLEVIVLFRDIINKYSRNNASNRNSKYDISSMYMQLTCLCTLAIQLSLFALSHHQQMCSGHAHTHQSKEPRVYCRSQKERHIVPLFSSNSIFIYLLILHHSYYFLTDSYTITVSKFYISNEIFLMLKFNI